MVFVVPLFTERKPTGHSITHRSVDNSKVSRCIVFNKLLAERTSWLWMSVLMSGQGSLALKAQHNGLHCFICAANRSEMECVPLLREISQVCIHSWTPMWGPLVNYSTSPLFTTEAETGQQEQRTLRFSSCLPIMCRPWIGLALSLLSCISPDWSVPTANVKLLKYSTR